MDNKTLAEALRQFRDDENVPVNAATLWRAICRGIDRVADYLENKGD